VDALPLGVAKLTVLKGRRVVRQREFSGRPEVGAVTGEAVETGGPAPACAVPAMVEGWEGQDVEPDRLGAHPSATRRESTC
jgi:hypothetical protein